jgi:hypothetical protein
LATPGAAVALVHAPEHRRNAEDEQDGEQAGRVCPLFRAKQERDCEDTGKQRGGAG